MKKNSLVVTRSTHILCVDIYKDFFISIVNYTATTQDIGTKITFYEGIFNISLVTLTTMKHLY